MLDIRHPTSDATRSIWDDDRAPPGSLGIASMQPEDTTPQAHRVELEFYARLSRAERVAMAFAQSARDS